MNSKGFSKKYYVTFSVPIVVAFIGFFLIDYDPFSQNPTQRYAKPFSKLIEINDFQKQEFLKEFSSDDSREALKESFSSLMDTEDEIDFSNPQSYLQSDSEAEGFDLEGLLEPEVVLKIIAMDQSELSGDSAKYWEMARSFQKSSFLGTDELGRDVYSRLVLATRNTILISIMVALFSALIGLIIGGLAGFYGGLADQFLMRVTDALLSLPLIPILIVLAAVDLTKVSEGLGGISHESQGFLKVIFILSLFSWMSIARLVRGSVIATKELEFVDAAKSMGARDFRIMISHIVPHAVTPVLAASAIVVGNAILIEAGLSFLGFGIQPPTPSLGNMLSNAQETIYEAPSLAVFPGLVISAIVLSVHFMGDKISKNLAK